MRVLLLNPPLPRSFWSLDLVVQVSGAKSLLPPLGLLTVAALLPREWHLRLVDLNTRRMEESDWQWADMVMITGMVPQKQGVLDLTRETANRGKIVVAGGPFATIFPEEVLQAGCDFLFVGEVEYTICEFVRSLAEGKTKGVFVCEERPDVTCSPIPRFDLVRPDDYVTAGVQTSRGCPFDCEFCNVVSLFGHKMRYKAPHQVVNELETLFQLGWRGDIFICDDNFIGNRNCSKAILSELTTWSKRRGEPYSFTTQVSVNLGQDLEMIDLMTEANFCRVFLGLETPDESILISTHKVQNVKNPLVESVKNISKNGLSIVGSFIIGFDGETKDAGLRICEFVDQTPVPVVMLGLLIAPRNTKLWKRLQNEGRLLDESDHCDSFGGKPNFRPTRPVEEVMEDLIVAWDHLYDPAHFLERTYRFYLSMRPTRSTLAAAKGDGQKSGNPPRTRLAARTVVRNNFALICLLWWQGIKSPCRAQFWRQLIGILSKNPSRVARYLTDCLYGLNMQRLSSELRARSSSA